MTIRVPSLLEVIGASYPTVSVRSEGIGDVYANIVHVSGDPIPSEAELLTEQLNIVKTLKKNLINDLRDQYLYDRFIYDGKRWDCDDVSRGNINGVLTTGLLNSGALQPGMVWRDYDNNNWSVDFAYMANMSAALATFTNSVYQNSWTHKANVDALTTIQDVITYDYSTNWPVIDI